MLRRLLLAVEHTWGTDTKSYLDNAHYRPADLAAVMGEPGYRVMEVSWQEKRDDISAAVASLPEGMRVEAERRLAGLEARVPGVEGMRPVKGILETEHFVMGVDERGAVTRLRSKGSGREWASAERALGLFTYQTISAEEYVAYRGRYIKSTADWAARDFGKPGIEAFGAVAREWHPVLAGCWRGKTPEGERVVLRMEMRDAAAEATGNVAWPREIYMELTMPKAEARMDIRVTTVGKVASRMPEAMWLTFDPLAGEVGWDVEKVGAMVNVRGVVRGGGRSMHAVSERVRWSGRNEVFEVRTVDAPLAAMGVRSPLNFSLEQPQMGGGVHFGLFNNAWGTNYPQWAGGDWSYRFSVKA